MKLRKNKNKNFFVAKKLEEAATKFAFMTFSDEKNWPWSSTWNKTWFELAKMWQNSKQKAHKLEIPLSCSHWCHNGLKSSIAITTLNVVWSSLVRTKLQPEWSGINQTLCSLAEVLARLQVFGVRLAEGCPDATSVELFWLLDLKSYYIWLEGR